MDFHKICRTCLGEVRNSKSLFSLHYINEEHLKLSEILTACTSIEVLENDNLPKQVCITCKNNILNTFRFQEQCHKSNSLLRVILPNSVQSQLNPLDTTEEISLKAQQSFVGLDSGVENFNSSLGKPIKIELNDEELFKDDNDCLANIGKDVENVFENFSKEGHLDSTTYSFKEENDESNLSSSYHTDSVHSQHLELIPSGIASKHIFKQNKVNNLEETITPELTSVKILKEDSDDDERNFGDEGHIESITYSFYENCENDPSSDCHAGSQHIDPNGPEGVEEETLQPLFPCKAEGCTACFTSLENFKEHSKKHLPDYCKVCDKTSPSDTLTQYMTSKHKLEERTQLCSGCGNIYTSSFIVKRNVYRRRKERPLSSEKCCNGIPKEVEDETLQPLFPCEAKGCTACFTELEDLKEHRKKHPREYCNICDKNFAGGTLSQHMTSKHKLDKKTHLCSDCGKEYTRSFNLKSNIDVGIEGPFSCEKCGKAFDHLFRLLRHMRIHSKLKNFICPVCDETIVDFTSLLAHSKTHDKIKSDKCLECAKRLSGPGSEATHSTDHKTGRNGKRVHVCDVCYKGFNQKCALKTHMLTHTGERNYICYICNKGFTQKCVLQAHIRLHTGEKPFTCNVCNKSFTHYSSYFVHKKSHKQS